MQEKKYPGLIAKDDKNDRSVEVYFFSHVCISDNPSQIPSLNIAELRFFYS